MFVKQIYLRFIHKIIKPEWSDLICRISVVEHCPDIVFHNDPFYFLFKENKREKEFVRSKQKMVGSNEVVRATR